jgi:bla regulator protein BlaR1
MSALLIAMNQFAAVGLAALLNTLWYAGAVVALTWLGLRFWPRGNAATRYWIWTAVLGFLLVLPFLPGLVKQGRGALVTRPETNAVVQPLAVVTTPPASMRQLAPVTLTVGSAPDSNLWPLWLLAVWLAAAGWQLTRLVGGIASVRRLKLHAEVAPMGALPVTLRRRAQVLTSAEIASPVAVGYIHPAVVIPPGLLARLEEGERQDVLLHELAHLQRYDDWMALATRTLGALLILHPLAAIVLGRIEREREMACDDFVVTQTGSARSYARSLARLHDLRWSAGTRLLASGILGRNSSLADRIESLLRRGQEFSARPSRTNLGVSTLLLAVLLGAGGLVPDWIAIGHAKPGAAQATASQTQDTAMAKAKFEVASIKPHKFSDLRKDGAFFSIVGRTNDGRFYATGSTLRMLIQLAYDVQDSQIVGGPSWIDHERWDIQAKADSSVNAELRKLSPDQGRLVKEQMLQNLLADRFKLTLHRETKQLPVYALVVAKHGPKLEESKDSGSAPIGGGGPGGPKGPLIRVRFGEGEQEVASRDVRMSFLAQLLSGRLARTVLDKTGLKGRYSFKLKWVADVNQGQMMGGPASVGAPEAGGVAGAGAGGGAGQSASAEMPSALNSSESSDFSGPSIFTAIQQQLGLKLKPENGPVEVLVVDRVEPPTPN